MIATEVNWLEELKAGDTVLISRPSTTPGNEEVATVTRVTRTTIIIGDAVFRRGSGRMRGGNVWSQSYLEPATPDAMERIRWRRVAYRVRRLMSEIPITYLMPEQWQRIQAIINEDKAQ